MSEESATTANLVVFRGYGTPQRLQLSGRALRNTPDVTVAGASALQNLMAAFNRLESDELANVVVRATYRGETSETISDGDGYFTLELELATQVDPAQIWHEVMELLQPDQPVLGNQ